MNRVDVLTGRYRTLYCLAYCVSACLPIRLYFGEQFWGYLSLGHQPAGQIRPRWPLLDDGADASPRTGARPGSSATSTTRISGPSSGSSEIAERPAPPSTSFPRPGGHSLIDREGSKFTPVALRPLTLCKKRAKGATPVEQAEQLVRLWGGPWRSRGDGTGRIPGVSRAA